MHRGLSRVLASATPLILVVTLSSGARADPPTFEDNAEKAVEQVVPELEEAQVEKVVSPSPVDPAQDLTTELVTFRGGGDGLMAFRAVGAIAPVEDGTPTERTSAVTVRRAKVGPRRVVIHDTSNSLGPGQLIAYWTERTGVNYVLALRTAKLDRRQLIKLVKAFPADDTKPPQRALRALQKPPKPAKAPERSANSKYLDGSSWADDDLLDEATLCNGCAYAGSNYTAWFQRILSADGFTPAGGFDCRFGSNTANATRSVQGVLGANQTGSFDWTTRLKVGQGLVALNRDGPGQVWYHGRSWTFVSERNGKYILDGKYLGYTYITLC